MKKYFKILFGTILSAMLASCVGMMDDAQDVPVIEEISVSYKVSAITGFVPKNGEATPNPSFSTQGLDVEFRELGTGKITKGTTDENGIVSVKIVPGNYSVTTMGSVENGGDRYFMNGNIPSISFVKPISPQEAADSNQGLLIRPAKVGSLILSEVYFCGIAPYYFRDQTYHIYNNGDKVEYLDGVCFANLTPNMVFEGDAVPVWPDEEGVNNYVYAEYVWKFPGTGKDYPLYPGESVVICQESRDHRENNPKSFDNSMAEWECWTGNATRNNPQVADMPLYYAASLNTIQWLVSVFGGAYCIFKPDTLFSDADGENFYENFNNQNTCTQVNKTTRYARIQSSWILDGVELLSSLALLSNKRVPGYIDAGAASVGETYCGKVVCRKVVDTRSDGTPIFADTNNSTQDYEVLDSPKIRRYGQKAPQWRPAGE